jgi:DNA-binding CsgD family transcriptional regulator
MSPTLSHEEHLEVLACIHELHRCRSLDAFPEHALRALAPVIPSTHSAFNEVNMPRGRIVATVSPTVENHAELAERWERLSGQHPLLRYHYETGDGQAVKFSDFLTEAEYHALDLYRDFYRAMRGEDQMSITLRSDAGVVIALAFNRARRDFTERDRVKLNLLRPHLLQAYANVEDLTGHSEEKTDLQTALRETGHGLIAVDARGMPAHATPGALDCVARFFPEGDGAITMPEAVMDWLESEPRTSFMLHAPSSRLILRSPRQTPRRLVLVSEERWIEPPDGGRLTPREAEVLSWLTEGKSNADIGAILAIAPGTVKQHVQSILAKLGVENRTAATVVARERGLIAPSGARIRRTIR